MSSRAARILVIEDDASIALGLRMNLEKEGYTVEVAQDGESGLGEARGNAWDLIILDLMLPRLNGYEVLSALRSQGDQTSVLVLTARSSEVDTVMGLDLGADDYVTKPFSLSELLARVRAALRRRDAIKETRYRLGEIEIDATTRDVRRRGVAVGLTATEFDVLLALVEAKGRILAREQIIEMVWGSGHHGTRRTVDNFIAQLRAKLEDEPADPDHLLTVRGVGYRVDTVEVW